MLNELSDNARLYDINGNFLHEVKRNRSATARLLHPNYDPNSNCYKFSNEEEFETFAKLMNERFTLKIIKREPTDVMATPAFIYAFDNLGPYRFTELCGLLLGSRHKGFLLGGVGADGKIDGEIDNILDTDAKIEDIVGLWRPESKSPLNNILIQPDETVIFQFKHITVSRAGGQTKARQILISLYENRKDKKSEVLSPLISKKKPSAYFLITNIEVNSNFRSKFNELCKKNNPNIKHYQIIGLDDLEAWIVNEKHLRHLYFPTIFSSPQFNLQLRFTAGLLSGPNGDLKIYILTVMNTGEVASYINYVYFNVIVNSELRKMDIINDEVMNLYNPKLGTILEPGRKHEFFYPFTVMNKRADELDENYFPVEVVVVDEINNKYNVAIPDWIREKMLISEVRSQT